MPDSPVFQQNSRHDSELAVTVCVRLPSGNPDADTGQEVRPWQAGKSPRYLSRDARAYYKFNRMKSFHPYVSHLEELLVSSAFLPRNRNREQMVQAALDGQPALELRKRVALQRLRASGAFFTGSRMARRAIATAFPNTPRDVTVLDPACGVGDLLVAFVGRLTCSNDFDSTLSEWGMRTTAFDIQPEFVRAAKLRLALAAVNRHKEIGDFRFKDFQALFPGIREGSSLGNCAGYTGISHILINPPFTAVEAPSDCPWGTGKVNSAALFMDACAINSDPGTQIIAILPDVLRSGSRYEKWRRLFSERVVLEKVHILGRFDPQTDVDVFLALGRVRMKRSHKPSRAWALNAERGQMRVGDKFDVAVGAVVPFRLTNRGRWCPFVQARNLPSWQAVTDIVQHRRFKGTTFRPPFVVVRRTSRPDDKHRAVATLVRSKRRIAVENHLLVLTPKDRTIGTCERLLKLLQMASTSEILNRRIRCRHLTVAALADLPWSRE